MKKQSNRQVQIRWWLFIAGVVLFHGLGAQRSYSPCWSHLDKPFYVTEDVVGYQLYLPAEFQDQEVVIKTIVMGPQGQEIAHFFHQTKGEVVVAGHYAIPADLPTSWYYFSFRVFDQVRQTERVLLQTPFAIYNDQQTADPQTVSQQEPGRNYAPVNIEKKPLQIKVTLEPTDPGPGEQVQMEILVTDHRGRPVDADVSVAIQDWSLLSSSLAMGMDNLIGGDSLRVVAVDRLVNTNFYRAVLVDAENRPIGGDVIRSSDGQAITVSEHGDFYLNIPYFENRKAIRWRGAEGRPARVGLLPTEGRIELGELKYTPAVFRYLQLSRLRKKAANFQEASYYNADFFQPPMSIAEPAVETILQGGSRTLTQGWGTAPPDTTIPSNPSLLWQPLLRSNADGLIRLSYYQGNEPTAYRIDVVAQSRTNQKRARLTQVVR